MRWLTMPCDFTLNKTIPGIKVSRYLDFKVSNQNIKGCTDTSKATAKKSSLVSRVMNNYNFGTFLGDNF